MWIVMLSARTERAATHDAASAKQEKRRNKFGFSFIADSVLAASWGFGLPEENAFLRKTTASLRRANYFQAENSRATRAAVSFHRPGKGGKEADEESDSHKDEEGVLKMRSVEAANETRDRNLKNHKKGRIGATPSFPMNRLIDQDNN
jgi:hypothetical protein